MFLHLHQTHHAVADFAGIFRYLKEHLEKAPKEGLHLLPELFLTGYPLQDLCLQKPFIHNYMKFLDKINQWSQGLKAPPQPVLFLMGGLSYQFDQKGLPTTIKNAIFSLQPGRPLQDLYAKRLLPNYDIFDEKKYFTPGKENRILAWEGKNLALLVCEDMWPSTTHQENPIQELETHIKEKKISLDLIVNLSASPFNINKESERLTRGKEISQALQAPFAYVNRVGGEDEILFDGQSFMVNGEGVEVILEAFTPKIKTLEWPQFSQETPKKRNSWTLTNTWENLFNPQLAAGTPPTLPPWSDEECQKVVSALTFGLQEYARKCRFEKFLVALSGGMDSALCLSLIQLSLRQGQSLEAIYMPSKFSASLSFDLSSRLCQQLQVPLYTLPIKFLHSVCERTFIDTFGQKLVGLPNENIQSRLRGLLLMTRSNQTGALVINTSNKSELAVGYSTLYGDSVGALSLLGDLYKTEVYQIGRFLNRKYSGLIPPEILDRPPTAELREDQLDSQSLPPYERLDPILEGILSYRMDREDLEKLGFAPEEIKKVFHLYTNSEYKRKQFCPIIKIKPKSFGFGHRVPITKTSSFYTLEPQYE